MKTFSKSSSGSGIILPHFASKSKNYVDSLFNNPGSASLPWEAFPDDYDPLDLIAADGEFDLAKMMDKAVDSITGLPRDIRLPEGDFPEAKNYFDYCENFVGPDTKFPFSRQMWAAIHLLAEYCPRCSHPKWENIFNVGVDVDPRNIPNNVRLLHYGKCPKCKTTKAELFANKELNLYVEAAWLWGQRSGKSILTASLTNYLLHKYLKFPKMSAICEGIQSSTPLTATFVGVRFADAIATLWEPITKGIHDSPWFREYHAMMDQYGTKLGIEFYRFKDQYLKYGHKNLEIYPAGPSKRALRGRTRFLCLTGDTLVNTDRGLVEIKNNLQGQSVDVYMTKNADITYHAYSGKKEVFEVTLGNGLSVTGSSVHPLLTLDLETYKPKWTKIENLTVNDYVVCGLGGTFPDELTLPSGDLPSKAKYEVAIEEMVKRKTFYLADITKVCGLSPNVLSITTCQYTRLGLLTKRKMSQTGTSLFSVAKGVTVNQLLAAKKKGSQRITQNRNKTQFPLSMTTELASVLGYLVADGKYTEQGFAQELGFGTTSILKAEDFAAKFQDTFGCAPRRRTGYKSDVKLGKVYGCRIAYSAVKDFLKTIGLVPAVAKTKEVPWSILQADRDSVVAFLSSAISCDGRVPNTFNKGLGRTVSYTSTSLKLLQQMQILFFKLGYPCHIKQNTDGTSKVVLKAYTASKFLDEYTGLEKRDWHINRERTVRRNSMSYSEYRIPGLELRNTSMVYFVHTLKELNAHSRINTSGLGHLIDKNFVFSKAKTIKSKGVKKTYDISVDSKSHAFVANGIVVHNTGLDELGWFPISGENRDLERADADEVHTALDRSLLTMRREVRTLYRKGYSNFIPGIAINISSPADETDKMCRLVEENRSSTRVLALQLATWEISPLFTKDNEEIADAYSKNPIDAERDYGAKPPMNARSFMDMSVAARGFNGRNAAHVTPFEKTINEKVRRAAALDSWSPSTPQPASVLSMDAGLTNNSFAITIMNLNQTKVGELINTRVQVQVAVEIQPRPGVMLHYSKIYSDVIKPMIKHFNVRFMFADRWNSVALLDTAEEDFKHIGLVAKQHSVKYPDFLTTRSYLEEGKLILPKLEMEYEKIRQIDSYPSYFEGKPAAHLLFQFATVRDMGSTVIKGGPYTDDIFRALVLGVGRILNPKIMEEILKMGVVLNQRNFGAVTMGRSFGMSSPINYLANRDPSKPNVGSTILSGYSTISPVGGSNFATSQVVRSSRTR